MEKIPAMVLFLAVSLLLSGCPGPGPGPGPNTTNATNGTPLQNFTCPDGTVVPGPSQCEIDLCPSSCDDGNICTIDACGKDTGYECRHTAKIPCCGDGVCESGENRDNCLADCGACPPDCDDGNPCTLDKCSIETGFNCTSENLSGNTVGCSGYIDFPGYSNVKYQFGTSPPEDWELDEDTKKAEGGVLFFGPEETQNCSDSAYLDGALYADPMGGYSLSPVLGKPWRTDAFDGLLFRISNKTSDPASVAYLFIAPDDFKGTEYIESVTQNLTYTADAQAETYLLGTTMSNVTFSTEERKIDNARWFVFRIAGFSNRTGEWEPEFQTHHYYVYSDKTYMVGFVDTQLKVDSMLFRPFPWRGCPRLPYRSSIAIYRVPIIPTYLLGDYAQVSLSRIANSPGYSLLDSGDQTLDGAPAKYYVASFVDNGYSVKRKAVLTFRKGKVYKLEFTAPRSSYDKDYPFFDSTVKSFKMLASPSNCKRQTCITGDCAIEAIRDCCGNGFCESGEECYSCPQDCGACSSTYKPLDAYPIFLSDEPKYYSTFNCENYLIRVRINNPLDEPMTVFAEDALRLKSEADSTCRAPALSSTDCLATMSGAFGDAYAKDTVEKKLTLFGYGGTEMEKGEILYAKTIRFNVTYDISWRGPYCFQFYCVPDIKTRFNGVDYTITGIKDYRGDILVGNWWCHANKTDTSWDGTPTGYSEIFFNEFYNKICQVFWSSTGVKLGETCHNVAT